MDVALDKPRDFDRQAHDMKKGKWIAEDEYQAALQTVAGKARDLMVAGIDSGRGGWAPLSEVTKQIKGSGRPLVDTGEMRDSIVAWDEGGDWFAGIPDDSPAIPRAAVHEKGAHVPVTDAVRKFFAAQGFPLRADTRFLRIPPRPWFRPAERELDAYVKENLDAILEPVFKKLED